MTDQDDTFCLPDLGEGLSEAEIVSWHVATGDRVVVDQPLVTVETDKAVVDIPSPRNGTVADCLGEPGDIVQVGDPLLHFSDDAARRDSGAVAGELPRHESRVQASPKARGRARELGVDLNQVTPSGPDGVIGLKDVEAASTGSLPGAAGAISGVRRAMARRMADANDRVAHASVTDEADISAWQHPGSPMPRLIRAIGCACERAPGLNAWFDDQAQSLQVMTTVNLGIAMETAEGLFVPVLEDIRGKTPVAIVRELEILEKAVVERSVRPEALRGQSITLSNFGAIGGLHAEMVVVPPQVAIVGAGRSFERLVMIDGTPATARILPLSVSFDHRVVTGVEACLFQNALIEDLERAD